LYHRIARVFLHNLVALKTRRCRNQRSVIILQRILRELRLRGHGRRCQRRCHCHTENVRCPHPIRSLVNHDCPVFLPLGALSIKQMHLAGAERPLAEQVRNDHQVTQPLATPISIA
jgi:hypothetical protein